MERQKIKKVESTFKNEFVTFCSELIGCRSLDFLCRAFLVIVLRVYRLHLARVYHKNVIRL